MDSNKQFPSLDNYISDQPPPVNYSQPIPNNSANYGNYPPPNDYNAQPRFTGGQPATDQQQKPPQVGLFQDMGFLQDTVYSQVSSRLFDNGRQYVDKNFGKFMTLSPLKYYFNVNNSYVFKKLSLLLFPFLHKNWVRSRANAHSDLHVLVPPREDINAPDLYIPIMAFVTYILMVGFLHGASLKFTPDVLGVTATVGLVVLGLEITFIKLSFYLLNTRSIPFLDLIAYCGYIFVGLIVNVFVSVMLALMQWNATYIITIYTGLCMAYFVFRSLGPAVPDMTGIPKMKTYLLVIAAMQVAVALFLGGQAASMAYELVATPVQFPL